MRFANVVINQESQSNYETITGSGHRAPVKVRSKLIVLLSLCGLFACAEVELPTASYSDINATAAQTSNADSASVSAAQESSLSSLSSLVSPEISLASTSLKRLGSAPVPGTTVQPLANPIMFVTQVPTATDFATRMSTFANHFSTMTAAPRGGDLMIRYPDGSLRNLTKEAGFGSEGFQGANAIAVREPSMHWSGSKALFSMVVGAPAKQFVHVSSVWQIYEVSGFGKGEAVKIRAVSNQPANFNNISPIYGTDEQILFTSDRPRNGAMHLYPQLDEYESTPTVTGIWKLNPVTGALRILNHTPSGAFSPSIDSFGRVIFTRWDHLQRDQQAESDQSASSSFKSVDYSSELSNATKTSAISETFPEKRLDHTNSYGRVGGHQFNIFMPWHMNEDGTDEVTLNHLGRNEYGSFVPRSFRDDPALKDTPFSKTSLNERRIPNAAGFFHMKEDPLNPGMIFAIFTREFETLTSGQMIRMNGAPSVNALDMKIDSFGRMDAEQTITFEGRFRNPLPTIDNQIVAAYTPTNSMKDYRAVEFRLHQLQLSPNGSTYTPAAALTGSGIRKSVSWWSPDQQMSYEGLLWEIEPVEVVARLKPVAAPVVVPTQEKSIFVEEGVNEATFTSWLTSNNLALIVTRNQTSRDKSDLQQPYNLRVPGGVSTVAPTGGKVYDISNFQLIQGEQVRGYDALQVGRRVIGRPMSLQGNFNPPNPGAPDGSVKIASDGSTAAIVPAGRAMAWQTVDPNGEPIVRERVWVTFQPGEVRVCGSCHGANKTDQADRAPPENKPEALRSLLRYWKTLPR